MAITEKKTPVRRTTKTAVKKEVLDAYKQLLPQMAEEAAAELKPDKKADQRVAAKVVAVADSISLDGITAQLSAVRVEIGKLLAQLSDRLEEEVQRYQSIVRAIAEKEAISRKSTRSSLRREVSPR